jgi:hypothetical protein
VDGVIECVRCDVGVGDTLGDEAIAEELFAVRHSCFGLLVQFGVRTVQTWPDRRILGACLSLVSVWLYSAMNSSHNPRLSSSLSFSWFRGSCRHPTASRTPDVDAPVPRIGGLGTSLRMSTTTARYLNVKDDYLQELTTCVC